MQCFASAGQRHGIDPLLLYAIAEVESRLDPAATNRNRDGSVDYGLMQVNSQHLPRLKHLGIDAKRLLEDPCLSVHTGASILGGMIARFGYTWTAVGAYNAGSANARAGARQKYAMKVWRRYSTLIGSRSTASESQPSTRQAASTHARPKRKPKELEGFRWSADDGQLVELTKSTASSFARQGE